MLLNHNRSTCPFLYRGIRKCKHGIFPGCQDPQITLARRLVCAPSVANRNLQHLTVGR